MKIKKLKSYNKALLAIHTELSPGDKLASRLVHSKLLWRLGELTEIFMLRLTPTIVGYICALTSGALFVCFVVIFNYSLKSLHILFMFFVIGYMIGIIVDYIKLLSPNQKR